MPKPKLLIQPLSYRKNTAPYFEVIRDLPDKIWLDSNAHRPDHQGRYDILSAMPEKKLSDTITDKSLSPQNPFDLCEQVLQALDWCRDDHRFPFCGGWMGYFGYESGTATAKRPSQRVVHTPDWQGGLYAWAVIVDHHQQCAHLVAQPCINQTLWQSLIARYQDPALEETDQNLADLLNQGITSTNKHDVFCNMDQATYTRQFERVMDYLHHGDAYQVNLARRWTLTTDNSYDPCQHYHRLRHLNPSPYAGFMELDGAAILSLSPELFLASDHRGAVTSKPIKGTIARHSNAEVDRERQQALLTSAKDRAENVMIVDLIRHDLAKHCLPGSVSVPELCTLMTYPSVHHLVSTVTGKLASRSTMMTLMRDAFPGGSITGAPKESALSIIAELEGEQRGPYCGSMGYLSVDGQSAWNILIRTMVYSHPQLHCHGGGGLTLGSHVSNEYQETQDKVTKLLASLL